TVYHLHFEMQIPASDPNFVSPYMSLIRAYERLSGRTGSRWFEDQQRIFAVKDRPIRSTAAGVETGSAPAGTSGHILGEPQLAILGGVTYTWWNVSWDNGLTGWSADFMRAPRFHGGEKIEVGVNLLEVRDAPAGQEIGSVALGTQGSVSEVDSPMGAFLGG